MPSQGDANGTFRRIPARPACAQVFYGAVWVLVIAAAAWRAVLTVRRWINADELEHLHAAWCVKQGMLLYRDFFEVHTPVFYYALAGILGLIAPETSMERGWAAILVCRFVMFGLTAVILWLVYRLGREMHSAAAGAMATVFVLSTMMCLERTTEVRPDVPSVAAMLGAVYLALRAFRGKTRRPLGTLFLAGALWSLGYLCTPKILMALLGFCPAVLLLLPRQRLSIRRQAAMGGSLLVGFLAPLGATVAFFAAQGALWEFVHYTLLLGIQWKHKLNPWDAAGELAYENPVLVGFGLAGLAGVLVAALWPGAGPVRRTLLIPAATAAGVIAGVFLVPVPYTEYLLMPVVFLAVLEGMVVVEMVRLGEKGWALWNVGRRRGPAGRPAARPGRWWGKLAVGGLGIMAVAWILWKLRPPLVENAVELCAWAAALLAAAAALKYRQRHAALAIALVMLSLFPLRRAQTLLRVTNDEQRARMAYVYQLTGPRDAVMDGWHNMAAPFRPHVWYWWFLPVDMRPLVPEAEYGAFAGRLERGETAPRVVVMDRDTEALPADVVSALKERYREGEVAPVWVRKN
jgi:hypothetical protein